MSTCTLCLKELDRRLTPCAFLVCEMGHEVYVHQKCFDRAIDKAIRVRSTRSTSFENIARSATHNWKTQKCALPDCIKWLSEYTQEPASDPAAAAAAEREANKMLFTKSRAPAYQEEEEEEDEEPDRCTEHKIDGSRCNFMISDKELRMCRRCAEKHNKSEAVKEMLLDSSSQRDNSDSNQAAASSASGSGGGGGGGSGAGEESPHKKKEGRGGGDAKEKKSKNKSSSSGSAGLNSMLKNLAKPSASPRVSSSSSTSSDGSSNSGSGSTNGSAGSNASSGAGGSKKEGKGKQQQQQQQQQQQATPPGLLGNGASFAAMASSSSSSDSVPSSGKQQKQGKQQQQQGMLGDQAGDGVSAISTDGGLIAAVRSFVGQHSAEHGGRTSPREIARFLGTLPAQGGSTAIDLMRSRFQKLRNLLEAYPNLFVLHEASPGSADGHGAPADYEVSLAGGGRSGTTAASGVGVGVGGIGAAPTSLLGGESPLSLGSGVATSSPFSADGNDLLAAILPKIKPEKLPLGSLDSILDQLGLARFQPIFREHEFIPGDLLLVTDDDLKDIGLPVGPRAKLRNWVKATVVGAG